jgi:hypothetical protein
LQSITIGSSERKEFISHPQMNIADANEIGHDIIASGTVFSTLDDSFYLQKVT